jgi:methyl-accepting chemotaxis protein
MYRTMIDMPLRFKFWMVNGFSFIGMSILSAYAITSSFKQLYPQGEFASAEYWQYFSDQALGYALWVFVLMCLVMGASQVLISFVHQHVKVLNKAMKKAAERGDLNVRVTEDCNDEIGQMTASFNNMQAAFYAIVSEVKQATGQVNDVADEFIRQTESACDSMRGQQQVSTQVMSEVETLKASSDQVLSSAQSAKQVSVHAEEVLNDGRSSIEQIISATKVIAGDVEQTATQINQLAEDSTSISGFVEVIRSISEQTNLLALNAAIEAARAGEQGRGFAVVADEVRSLASKTHEATDKIGDILNKFAELTNAVVQAMEQSRSHVAESVEHADLAQSSFAQIARSVTELAESNQVIEQEAHGQADNTERVVDCVRRIESVTSNTVSGAKGIHLQAESLQVVAHQLRGQLNKFQAE